MVSSDLNFSADKAIIETNKQNQIAKAANMRYFMIDFIELSMRKVAV